MNVGTAVGYLDLDTSKFKNGVKTKSKTIQEMFERGLIIAIIELTNPPNEINGKNKTIDMFAKSEYKLKVLK